MSIRRRLTLFYSTILALTLIAFSTILYATQTRFTYDSNKANLVRQAGIFVNGPRPFPAPGEPSQSGGGPPPEEPFGGALPDGTLPGRWTQTRSSDGTVTGRTYDLTGETLPLSEKGLQAVLSGAGWFETAQVQEQPLLIYSQSFQAKEGTASRESTPYVIVQVAFPIGEREQSLYWLRLILVVGCSVAIVASFAIGWFLAGAALRPIHRITDTAQAIGAERSFSRRVEHVGPADEVGRLAVTFNAMLAELESAYRQLEGSLDSQRRFVADASHELRTPLTTVRGNIELLRRDPPIEADERAEILVDTTGEVDRLIRLVNQLLVLARVDAGQELLREPLPLKPLIEDVCRQAKLLAPDRSILYGPAVDLSIMGNRDALKQVLLILLDNALVHTAAGATVEIGVSATGGRAAISVRDTGAGVAPDALPHIFERFYRGQVSRSGAGTGLGLSIARELVRAQDGTIAVESQLGQGSVFTVTLPQAG